MTSYRVVAIPITLEFDFERGGLPRDREGSEINTSRFDRMFIQSASRFSAFAWTEWLLPHPISLVHAPALPFRASEFTK